MQRKRKILISLIIIVIVVTSFLLCGYMLYLGFTPSPRPYPAGTIKNVEHINSTITKNFFSDFKPETKWNNIRIAIDDITNGESTRATINYSNANLIFWKQSDQIGIELTGKDISANNRVDDGDYFIISFLKSPSGKTFNVYVIHIPTLAQICEKEFSM